MSPETTQVDREVAGDKTHEEREIASERRERTSVPRIGERERETAGERSEREEIMRNFGLGFLFADLFPFLCLK